MLLRTFNRYTGFGFWYSVKFTFHKNSSKYNFATTVGLSDRRDAVTRKYIGRMYQGHFYKTAKDNPIFRNGKINIELSYIGWFKARACEIK